MDVMLSSIVCHERRARDSKMKEKENGLVHEKMIDRNWVLKRKRKRLSSGSEPSNGKEGVSPPSESPRNNSSGKRRLQGDSSMSRSARKKKGNDGYYFECVICDLGGNLLCCDSCPRTYHLQCLNPPLKRTPPGKWQCSNCCEGKDSVKPINHPEAVSRRARTKITGEKSKTGIKPGGSEKLSQIVRSSIFGKKKSSKGKTSVSRTAPSVEKKSSSDQMEASCGTKLSHSSDGGYTEGILPCTNIGNKKELNLPNGDASVEKKPSSSPPDEVPFSVETSEPVPKEEPFESKADFLLPNNGSPGKKSIAKKDRKRKQKVNMEDNPKKSRTDKGKSVLPTIPKRKSKATSTRLGTTRPRQKNKSIDRKISLSKSKEDLGIQKVAIREHDEGLPEASHSSHSLEEQGVDEDKIVKHEENGPNEVQQVDRILGCRLQSSDTTSATQIRLIKFSTSPAHTESENNSITLASGLSVDDKDTANQIDGEKSTEDVNGVGKLHLENPVLTKCVEEIDATTFREPCKDLDLSVLKDDIGELSRKIVPEENIAVELVKLGTYDAAENQSQDAMVKTSMPSNMGSFSYEFLVKWVGKSNIHNTWISESELKIIAKRKLENYKAKYGTAVINICQEQWSKPQRVIALRACKDGSTEALVKWCDLPYDDCTWERLDEHVIEKSAHLIDQFKQFDKKAVDKDGLPTTKVDHEQSEILPLVKQPEELRGGSLFPHQLEALNWLRKCWHKSKNVILADEMGLGKTVSACAFISSLYLEFNARLPCLVLVPLSTMRNWLAEFSLWAPHLNVVEYHGCAKARSTIRDYEWHASDPDKLRKKTKSFKFNVLLTTYEMVLVDSSHLRGVPWEVLIVDEGHRLKNSESKLFGMLNSFSFQHRVLLTGTPLQNNIGEMYNLLNFLQPASFPSLSAFEEKFNDLTTAEKVDELKKLVAPHMLRRLKKDAMQNIPPKTERMVPVELSSVQAEYYRAMLTKNYQLLRNIGKGVAQQSMLNIVMQLRKVCNHPYLIPGTEPDSGSVEFLQEMRIKASAKLTLLHSMLKILHKEGHRVLIFSQMTKLLDILEDYMTIEYGPKTFERVDGSVSVGDRQAAIARFNQDKTRFVFLLSTRSCGLGINLATADTVIIYDSDFNPHADIQAMNRAHRIGQSNRLLVYRLVVRASVEERILQLAKRKLMLDQLFVNKSESQKEVEDILRWGTEELFRDCVEVLEKFPNEDSCNKVEASLETEQKHRRRGGGGLGDVYKDKCTDGTTNILWDETAILRLLDRSNIQLGTSESTEGEPENDMLGSVKSLEWNDEPNEEQVGNEFLPSIADEVGGQSSEKKEDQGIGATEENEWDRLLRTRWEKYQNEEEAALGRGKRLRKAISYKETFAPHPIDAQREGSEEEEEPVWEYTPAGRALKERFAKLRARQKERIARKNIIEESHTFENQLKPKSLPEPAGPINGESLHAIRPIELLGDPASPIILEDKNLNQLSEAPKNRSDSISRLGKFSKHGFKSFLSANLDLSVRPPSSFTPDIFLPSHQFTNSMPNSNMLPVLGLCAPTANQLELGSRNFKSYLNLQQSRTGTGVSDFPFRLAPGAGPSMDMEFKGRETNGDTPPLPDTAAEVLNRRLRNSMQDSCFLFNPCRPTTSQGRGPDPLDGSGATFSSLEERPPLQNIAIDGNPLSKFSLPTKSVPNSRSDLLSGLSLGMELGTANASIQNLPTIPWLPDFRPQPSNNQKQRHQPRDILPMLGQSSSLSENHKKVLDNIMKKTGSGTSNLSKSKSKVDSWSEDELDALWIGVRRHGRGNWEAMLRNPKLRFSKYRTPEDLSGKWEEEQLKILDGAPKTSKSTTFPAVSDAMMTRALFGSRFTGNEHRAPPKFRSHLTDIQLGYGDMSSNLPRFEPIDHFNRTIEHCPPIPVWKSDKFSSAFSVDFPPGPSDRPGSSNLPMEQPFLLNSLGGTGSLVSQGINYSSSCNLQQKDEQFANKYFKLPSLLDKSLNFLRDCQNNRHSGESSSVLLPDSNKSTNSNPSPITGDNAGSSSSKNKLPHWLREAVNVPAKPPEPNLPPTVSAIAHSVRLLYGEEKPSIPPFTVPGPRLLLPKDPRKSLKKKKKHKILHNPRRSMPDIATSSNQATASTSSFRWIEPNPSISGLNLNLMNPSPSSPYLTHIKKPGAGLSPSPEVLNLVASCVAPGPPMSPSSHTRESLDLKGVRGKRKARRNSVSGCWGKLPEERTDRTESGDSSQTQSDPCHVDRPELEEVSSEETVSDDHRSEQES